MLSKQSFCSIQSKRLPFDDYLKEMAEYKFALSPRGWGPDCYRTWEALLVGTIPIVKRNQHDLILSMRGPHGSQLDRLYENLPILVIDDWKEITQEFLEEQYKIITSKSYDIRPLYIEFWYDRIMAVRDAYFKRDM